VHRRAWLAGVVLPFLPGGVGAARNVSTLIGSGAPGHGDGRVNDPYGMAIAPDGALWFCDLGNQRIRRIDLRSRATRDVAGDGRRAYAGDGGPATGGALNMPHEIAFDAAGHLYVAERDNHVIRRIEARTGLLSTVAGTGTAGFSGDGGPASAAQLRGPHSVAMAPDGRLLICDVGNHRVRAVDLRTRTIETIGGTGEQQPTADGALLRDTPLNGPRAIAVARDGTIYLALREGHALYAIAPGTGRLRHLAGTGTAGYTGDGGPARRAALNGPKGLAVDGRHLYVADTENHAIRELDLRTGVITTVRGTGARGDGPDGDPRRCALARPHGVLVHRGHLSVGDSEAHRIRVMAV
jgi:DNA-binding beta-propeller fold protein YncE